MEKDFSNPDVVLIGAGIMSATLGIILKELEPDISIEIFERLDKVAEESSDAWNNAGTGHSAFCELNYTPQLKDGSIDISKAIKVAEEFEISRELWAYIVSKDYITRPDLFINPIPHMSFVTGKENVEFLKYRHRVLSLHPLFQEMQYSDNPVQLMEWMPLIMTGRSKTQTMAATRMEAGTDINFGALTRFMFDHLKKLKSVKLHLNHEVKDLKKSNSLWRVYSKDLSTNKKVEVNAKFVFIGAGGGALPLLEKSGIPERKGYGGFPVNGQWLICENENIIKQHSAKVYGKASEGSPPISVPHLDARMIREKKNLLFGPYAGFSTKFLKHGSLFDLPASINFSNLRAMIFAGFHNIKLVKYLISEVRQSPEDRLQTLKEFVPTAKKEDWKLFIAGQRVQIIKKDKEEGGILEFGTELVSSADGSLAALLGASPGASTSAFIMLELLNRCFINKVNSREWQFKLKRMAPSYGLTSADDAKSFIDSRNKTGKILKLEKELTIK